MAKELRLKLNYMASTYGIDSLEEAIVEEKDGLLYLILRGTRKGEK